MYYNIQFINDKGKVVKNYGAWSIGELIMLLIKKELVGETKQ